MTGGQTTFEQDPAAQNERLVFALQAAGVGTWDYDLQTGQAQWSGICKQLFGLLPDVHVTAEILLNQVHPDDQQWVDEANQQALDPAGDGQHDIVFRTLHREGTIRWVEAKGKTIRNESGLIIRFSGIVQDVTQAILAREQVDIVQRQMLDSFEQSTVAIAIITDPDLTFRRANLFFCQLAGRRADELVGKSLLEALPELAGQRFDTVLRQVIATGVPYIAGETAANLTRSGKLETIYVDLTCQPMRDVQERVTGALVVATDVTQQVLARRKIEDSEARYRHLSAELEKQVDLRTQELEVSNVELAAANEELIASNGQLVRSNENLQRFAYIASHDLQEPLRKIQQFGSLLQNQYAHTLGEGVDYLQRMQVAASRMSTLIRDLLAFSRISTWQDAKDEVSLNEIISLVLSDLEMVIQETSAVVYVDHLPVVLGDDSQLGQLFQNLISNALKFKRPDAVPEIGIRTFMITASQLPDSVKPARLTNAYHRIDVSDNGIGFEQKYTERIFQVFQRLHGKNQYAGTGIGLAICEKVVFNHGGAITATAEPGCGATFSVYLPA